jgi:hypothetical protein
MQQTVNENLTTELQRLRKKYKKLATKYEDKNRAQPEPEPNVEYVYPIQSMPEPPPPPQLRLRTGSYKRLQPFKY